MVFRRMTPSQVYGMYQTYAVTVITYGWFGGGDGPTDLIDRITLADDTENAIDRCNLFTARRSFAGFTDNIYGWFGGGYIAAVTDLVDRITLANDTANALDRCNLFVARYGAAGFTGK